METRIQTSYAKDLDLQQAWKLVGEMLSLAIDHQIFSQDNLNIYVFKDIKQLAFFLIFILFLSGGISGAYWYAKQPPKLTEDYNMPSCNSVRLNQMGRWNLQTPLKRLRSDLFDYLDSEYASSSFGFKVQVEQKNMPLISKIPRQRILLTR